MKQKKQALCILSGAECFAFYPPSLSFLPSLPQLSLPCAKEGGPRERWKDCLTLLHHQQSLSHYRDSSLYTREPWRKAHMFIRNLKKLNKRGFTLIELTMVMAISAIISAMIISFCTLISAQTKKNELRADFMQNVTDLRTDLQIAFAEVDGTVTEYHFTVDVVEKNLNIENTSFFFKWNDYEYIDSIELSARENGEILKVLLTNSSLSESQSFVLISKTGGIFVET